MTRLVVIKLGGHALEAAANFDAALDALANGVGALRLDGLSPVVVHGAGPQITSVLHQMGIETTSINGYRVTDHATMDVVAMALSLVNLRVVAGLNARGIAASGLTGPDCSMLRATLKGDAWGLVGDHVSVDATAVISLVRHGVVPVVCPVGVGPDHQLVNCNADTVAGSLAAATRAEALILLSDVDQIRRDPDDPATALAHVTREEIDEMVASGAIRGGMLPKVAAALCALDAGAARVVVASGSSAASFTSALRHEGRYTEVIA